MKVSIAAIDQSYSLENGTVSNFAVIQLPSGHRVRVAVDDASVQAIIAESQGTSSHPQTEGAALDANVTDEDVQAVSQDLNLWDDTPQHTPAEEREQLEHHVADGVVEWETLPDTQLPPQMKHIMRQSKINPIISIADLDQLKAQILEHLNNAKTPKAGKVKWNEGAQRQAQSRPRRTVPMDEAGNPKPPGGITEADPGEGPDDDGDEDGVAQA